MFSKCIICISTDDPLCAFDFVATGNEEIAEDTKISNENVMKDEAILCKNRGASRVYQDKEI